MVVTGPIESAANPLEIVMKPIHLFCCVCLAVACMVMVAPTHAQCTTCPSTVVWSDTDTLATTVVTTTTTASEVRTANAGPVRRLAGIRPVRRAIVVSGRIARGVGRVALAPFRLFRCRR